MNPLEDYIDAIMKALKDWSCERYEEYGSLVSRMNQIRGQAKADGLSDDDLRILKKIVESIEESVVAIIKYKTPKA